MITLSNLVYESVKKDGIIVESKNVDFIEHKEKSSEINSHG